MVDSHPIIRDPTKESIARFFLSFGHIFKLFRFILGGFIYGDRKICPKATIFIFFSMIYNTLLKYIFKVPLYPHLGKGYSFPSGHMHAYGLFYGYFILHSKKNFFQLSFLIVFVGISISLVYMRYHRALDVFGSILLVFFELFIDQFLTAKYGEKLTIALIIIICLFSTFCLYLKIHEVQYHIWLAWYSMTGIILAFYFIKINDCQNFIQKTLALFVTFSVRFIIEKIWNYFNFDDFYLSEIPFLLAPILTVFALKFSMLIKFPNIFIDSFKNKSVE